MENIQMRMPLALKIKRNSKEIDVYTSQLLNVAVTELMESNITEAQYSKVVDLITCLNIKSDEIQFEITSYLNDKKRKRKFSHGIDLKA
ncbi:hypothetical protein [Paraliobacillus sp. X-1268]|uniref:hypothetical protein n=1 Tax=Paraliobacillus sp. X-1268 TaxID=2213193 RepID=UPI000E3E664D|nr:hypothetical protein [Paraliobacillus sp. X-1268]